MVAKVSPKPLAKPNRLPVGSSAGVGVVVRGRAAGRAGADGRGRTVDLAGGRAGLSAIVAPLMIGSVQYGGRCGCADQLGRPGDAQIHRRYREGGPEAQLGFVLGQALGTTSGERRF